MVNKIQLYSTNFKKMRKFVYHEDDKLFHAGGLILYDSNGVWLIKEYYKETYKLIDPGGKYCYQDCTIFNTILREFHEETYFSIPLYATTLQRLIDSNKANFVYVCPDVNCKPTYACLLVDLTNLGIYESPNITYASIFEKAATCFLENRNLALKSNPDVPQHYYSSFELVYVPYSDFNANFPTFHFRLKQIFLHSFFKQYLKI